MAIMNHKSCLLGCGTAMFLTPLIAAFLFVLASLASDHSLSDRQDQDASMVMVALSAFAGLGAGVIVYALTRKNSEE